ncbi:MAG: cellulase family glycosylhydrolase, partial [Bacteroidales bacterium]|nr:cellulase family glycosylhydrolase [Bacteroidales bacterium]
MKANRCESPEYFIGTNMWYASRIAVEEPQRLSAELDSLKAYGISNVRVLATDENWEGMDLLLKELSARKMQAVLFLNNAWEWSEDGYRSYMEKAGAGVQPHPAKDGYYAYMVAMAGFAQNEKAVELYQEHVRKVVERYKGSDAIYSWQVCNEPRPFSTEPAAVEAFYKYVQGTAALIKSIDPDHMVSTGNEGQMGCEKEMSIYEKLNDCPDIDYITIHIWPYNWGWVKEDNIAGGAPEAIEQVGLYIDSALQTARKLGKKVVIEEFGYPRDGFSFNREAPVTGRDAVYKYVFTRVLESARNADVLLGCNFWAWSGLARQTPGHDFWQEGDDLCGDPFQEGQGLNGVYLSDASTLSIVRSFADSLSHAVSVDVPVEHDWMFYGKGPCKLSVNVASNLPLSEVKYSIKRDLDLMDYAAEPIFSSSVQVRTHPAR